ncbi:hypothetical protein NMG60_11035988 [Bertholletia excelsa]
MAKKRHAVLNLCLVKCSFYYSMVLLSAALVVAGVYHIIDSPRMPKYPTPTKEDRHERPTPTEEYRHERPTPTEEDRHERPTPTEEYHHERPTPTEEYRHERPTPTKEDRHERPTPTKGDRHERPTPIEEDLHERPTPTEEDRHERPTLTKEDRHQRPPPTEEDRHERPAPTEEDRHERWSRADCDLFSGRWVYDNESHPPYRDRNCSFMNDDLACEKYGRKDLNYQYWRWQPHGCNLPRFDARALLERLRGKRLVFVGDSVNRNQWVSMICLVESSIPKGFKHLRWHGSLYSFKATEYNASIDFYWAPLLVESNSDDPSNHRLTDRIVRIESIEKHAVQWSDASVLVFNSYLWWRIPKLKVLKGHFGSPHASYKEVNALRAYKMALKTWSNWVATHLNPNTTQLFFVSMPATHSRAQDWGMPERVNCLNETEPILEERYSGSGSDPKMMQVAEGAVRGLRRRGMKIEILNITQLSEYRKDAHPTIYKKQWHPLTKEQLSDPRNYADCTHWCLPGVPDVWNELLHLYILYN